MQPPPLPQFGQQKRGQYKNLIRKMLNYADTLRRMLQEDIPEVFTMADQTEGDDPNFFHTPTDFMYCGVYKSRLDDAMGAYDIIKKILEILEAERLILKNMYPNQLKAGPMMLNMGTDFQDTINRVDEDIKRVNEIGKKIYQEHRGKSIECIDQAELRQLRKRLIVLAYQSVRNNFELPRELQIMTSPSASDKGALKEIEQNITPQVVQYADSLPPDPFAGVTMRLSDSARDYLRNSK
jgi:hypothetical protein